MEVNGSFDWDGSNRRFFFSYIFEISFQFRFVFDFFFYLGAHDAENFSEIPLKYTDKYSLGLKISAITPDNASVNGKIAQLLSRAPNIIFSKNHILRCCAHVIILAAKQRRALFEEDSGNDEDLLPPSLNTIVNPPDNTSVDLKSIYAWVHGLALFTCKTPQHSQSFASVISLVWSLEATSDLDDSEPNELEEAQNKAFEHFQHQIQSNHDELPTSGAQSSNSANRADRLVIDFPTW